MIKSHVLYRLSYGGKTYRLTTETTLKLERVMGIEPTLSAWKAEVLPLNYTRLVQHLDPSLTGETPVINGL